jgi:hypothetical protein
MSTDYLTVEGLIIPPSELTLPRARGLARLLESGELPFAPLVECRRGTSGDGVTEAVVFDAVIECPQVPVHDIRKTERIAAVFHAADTHYPEALALRPTFPRVPHLNAKFTEFPRSLCLYDKSWPEVALRWTPAAFVERVRYWLAQTARGVLHQDDQPLEQLLFDSGLRIILPNAVLKDVSSQKPVRLDMHPICDPKAIRTLIAVEPQGKGPSGIKFVAVTFTAEPQKHGIIRSTPTTLAELHEFLTAGGIDLLDELRPRLDACKDANLLDARLAIIVAFPLTRKEDSDPEKWDFWAFLTFKTVREVGIEIGHWGQIGPRVVNLIGTLDPAKRGQGIHLALLSPYLEFTRSSGAVANGIEPDLRKVVAVGAGALGSQVIVGLARTGFGRWTVIDEDDLLPHNLARHVLPGDFVGIPKAPGVAIYLNQLYSEEAPAKGIVADVLSPGDESEAIAKAFSDAEVILDIAASVPVARHLAISVESKARRVSVFLNPTGTDVVVLAEDKKRTLPLDALEMQYYRAAATDERLNGHIGSNPGRLRYGRSCRDITSAMPTHLVAMHAALASEAVRRAVASDDASIRVWRCDPATSAVTQIEIAPVESLRHQLSGWTIVLDRHLLARLTALRAAKLPKETGGVLIGSYDLTRRIVYAVDTVPSPPDSKEWPTLYIRGSEGLLESVRQFSAATGGQLEYTGEWHSHPDGIPALPSSDDMTVFGWLTEHLSVAGFPALMAILGERGSSSWFLGEISEDNGWGLQC